MKNIAILGSTGSIGTQTLQVIDANPGRFNVEVLTANNQVELLARQARKFKPNMVVIGNEAKYSELTELLKDEDIKVYAGSEAIAQVVQTSTIDVVVTAMVGYSGLLPTINAIKAGKTIALANKETLVCEALPGLYPCGEGAGYAGGIMTAAVDGVRCAAELMKRYKPCE